MAYVITLTGPSQCGKSTIREMILKHRDKNFKPVIFKKYTTRRPREFEDDTICVDNIPHDCDLVYEQYGVRYGFHFDDLYDLLEKGKSPIIVLNDVRAVEDVRTALAPQVKSLFLYRNPPDKEKFIEEEKRRAKAGTSEEAIAETAQSRYDKAKAIYRIYIENIYLFDNVILNIGSYDFTKQQVAHVVEKMKSATKKLKG